MPTYQYACPDCGAEFEKVQKFTDKPVKKCPKCGKAKVHRVVSRVSVSFKGSGFYVNDSKSSSSTSSVSAKAEKAEKSEKTEKTEKVESTETKTEVTAEAKPKAETTSESKPAESKKSGKAKDGA
jgi:putative FmdB family regulatory protein